MILNRRQFMQMLGAAAASAGLKLPVAEAATPEVAEVSVALPEVVEAVDVETAQSGIVITGVTIDRPPPFSWARDSFTARPFRVSYDGPVVWTVTGRRGVIEEEYCFVLSKDEIPHSLARDDIFAFVEPHLNEKNLVSRSSVSW